MKDQDRAGERPVAARASPPSARRPARLLAWLRHLPLHPFLFASASVFALYASNLRELSFPDVAAALAGGLGAALVLFLVFGAVFRRFGTRAALLASIVIVMSLYYAELVVTANRLLGAGLSFASAWPVMAAIAGVLVAVAARVRSDLVLVNTLLNGIAFVLFITPAWQVASHAWTTAGGAPFLAEASDAGRAGPSGSAAPAPDPARAGNRPDIYYIIFDRYGSESTLADHYGLDNSALIGFLEEQGFYLAAESHSNYLKTAHSLASTFHMDHLDFLAKEVGKDASDWHPLYAMLKEHRVTRFLKSVGYEFIQIGSWWGPTQYNPFADENYSFGYGEFTYRYLGNTIIPPVLQAGAPASTIAWRLRWDAGQCQRVPQQIAKLKEIGARRETTFTFAHLLLPHGPYVFDEEGRCLSRKEAEARDERQGYIEQLRYANTLIRDLVSALQAGNGAKPVIIIQADEGPFPERYPSSDLSWREASAEELKVKTGILNAYYFPDGDYSGLYSHITPVNTFPLLFNKYFGTKIEQRPDRVYAFPDVFRIYDFFDVTDIVRGD